MASGFGAWRNGYDHWEGILKFTRDQPRELELTLGCRQESFPRIVFNNSAAWELLNTISDVPRGESSLTDSWGP